ncbi:DNA polymerase III subunit epsilon [Segetibacter sp. 3557_3]|uniref:exonuclease domain-containing protein n=1 Tax=Segetibacter sp. 3557_3 TaxID=2547429 RepID=UPI001058A1B5|nr:exonuclease domain-containing protein [Segetibacter sp. 3557_3]TDH28999.1 DNA polymerase III subunit epsilon [Segetibacter sp. 3557_3]
MFAIVDIETTGGYASANGITEIAIAIYDGEKVVDYFDTLVNPLVAIPPYIQALTGITNAMVSQAPLFEEVAGKIYELLSDKVFVAHNVNFDYSFVKYHLSRCGFDLDCKKLCTVRLGRKIFPGQHSYSLGNLCRSLSIEIEQRHRAGGDARATVKLFQQLLCNDQAGEINLMLKGRAKDQHLPPNLQVEKVTALPCCPGVYYFHNQKGKVIYVGKAKDLRKRVASHFSNNKTGKQKQEFLRNIYDVTYHECGSELMAFILESIEIKRLWPLYNRSLKGFEQAYGLYAFEDNKGYQRLVIEKKKKHLEPIYTFSQITEGQTLIKKLIADFGLCPRLCFIDVSPGPSLAEEQQLSAEEYNERISSAVKFLGDALPTFALCEEPSFITKETRKGVILMEKGRFYGMGYLPPEVTVRCVDDLKPHLTQYPENGYIRGLLYQYSSKYPERKVQFSA